MPNINSAKLNLVMKIMTVMLLAIAFCSCFSLNHFYLFGHIESVADVAFCVLQWIKLAGLVVIPAAVFLKTERFDAPIRYLLVWAPLLSLLWTGRYAGLESLPDPSNAEQVAFAALNRFMPDALILSLFIAESLLMTAIAGCFWVRHISSIRNTAEKDALDAPKMAELAGTDPYASAAHGVCEVADANESSAVCGNTRITVSAWLSFLAVLVAVTPLNLFDNLVRLFPAPVYSFFEFANFTVWHALALVILFAAITLGFLFLRRKTSAQRYRYLRVLSLALLVQYMSKASALIGDGYNVYYSILAFIPLFICNIGVPVVAAAIFTKNKTLNHLAFFIHAAGALTVFVYFGRDEMSNFGTVFNYSFLYFTFTHSVLFVLCLLPTLLGEQTFKLKNCVVPLVYYGLFILTAAVVSQIITSYTAQAFGFALVPNFAFTQVSPVPNPFPSVWLNILGLQFDVIYLPLLFAAHIVIFFATYAIYYACLGRRKNAAPKPI